MIKVTKDQFYKLKFETDVVIDCNPGIDNAVIREKASKIKYSLEEIERDFVAVEKLMGDNVHSVFLQDYIVGQIRDLMRKVQW